MEIKLKRLSIENFKGCKSLTVDFTDKTLICGQNASGKTTVLDAVTWLLFGKDSQDREKFEIRPLDQDGNKIHNVEISVVGEFEIDGKAVTFTRKQKENWVKKRGSESPTFQGNVNEMMINDFPKSDREYKEEVSKIVDEGLFKALSNPMYFPSLAWKEQRQMLMGFVSDISDVDLAKEIGGFDDILSDLEYANNTDDIAKKYTKAKKELSDKVREIPIRIDEVDKSRVYIDVPALENKRSAFENQLSEVEKQLADGSVNTSDLDMELSDVKQRIREIEDKAIDDLRKIRVERRDALAKAEDELQSVKRKQMEVRNGLVYNKRNYNDLEENLNKLKNKYIEIKESVFPEDEWVFDERSTICKLCGRPLDQDKIDEIKADFEKRKSTVFQQFEENRKKSLSDVNKQGKEVQDQHKDLGKKIIEAENEISELDKEIAEKTENVSKATESLNELPDAPDYTDNKEYNDLLDKQVAIEEETAKRLIYVGDTTEMELHRDELKRQIAEVTEEIGLANKNKDIDSRIKDLEEEMRTVQQKLADAERMEYLLDNFIKAKMERVSKTINDQFEICDFKLFETQINGGIKECCELTVNGIPYSVLNSGHRIVAGLDIIKSLEKLLGCAVPVWVDNSETINSFNIPQMDCQAIFLKVTEDDELQFM